MFVGEVAYDVENGGAQRDEGIDVLTNTRITRVEGKSGQSVKLSASRDGSELVLEGTDLLVAASRRLAS